MGPQISIVIPAYNAEKYIERCVDSIINQTFQDFEIIIVNNGSTDGTKEICKELEKKDVRISFQDTGSDNKGVSFARNIGIQKAAGEYISFVDADDILCPDVLEVLWKHVQNTGAVIAGCSFFQWKSAEDIPSQEASVTEYPVKTYSFKEYVPGGILNGDTRCWSKLYRRDCVMGCWFDETLSIGEDMLFLLTIMVKEGAQKDVIAITDYPGYGYFWNEAGAINRTFKPAYLDQIRCWEKAEDIIARYFKEQTAKVKSLGIIGAMLVVGKLAMLPASEREKVWIDFCHEFVKTSIKEKKAFLMLSGGYRIKVIIFRLCPRLYIAAYHSWKKRGLN